MGDAAAVRTIDHVYCGVQRATEFSTVLRLKSDKSEHDPVLYFHADWAYPDFPCFSSYWSLVDMSYCYCLSA